MVKKKRVLVAYFLGGAGHKSFAVTIKEGFSSLSTAWEIALCDVEQDLPAPSLGALYVEAWKRLMALPLSIQQVLFFLNRSFYLLALWINDRRVKKVLDVAVKYLEIIKPDLIIATHWGASHLFVRARERARMDFQVWMINGELGGEYQLFKTGANRYWCMTDKARQGLIKIGVDEQRVYRCSFFLQAAFQHMQKDSREARAELGLDPDRFTVVFSLGGEGIGKTRKYVRYFARHCPHAQLVVLTGRNAAMLKRLQDDSLISRQSAIKIFGFLPEVLLPFQAAHLFAGKFGASFASEAMFLRRPVVIVQLAAPHESHTKDFLVREGFGWYLPSPRQFAEKIEYLATHPEDYQAVLQGMNSELQFTGGEDIAQAAISVLGA
jgi:1,2-diacylglycerol 3-beta-galactosyltransferase